jgi:hypothetical protein
VQAYCHTDDTPARPLAIELQREPQGSMFVEFGDVPMMM